MVHPNKSIFFPAISIEYLGFVTDSQSMTISLTKKKKACIKQLCHKVLQEEFLIIRKITRLLCKFTSSFPAVHFGPLHYRSLEQDKILALKFAKGNFDKKMKVSQAGKMDILWWINNTEDSFSPIQVPNCSFLLKTGASKSGWGAIFNKESTGGQFALDESLLHSNVLELKALLFGLKSSCCHLRQTHIKVSSDNTTTMCAINNMDHCKSFLCHQEVRRTWSWATERDIFITVAHIPGILNVEADQEPRKSELRTEWKLHDSIFGYIKKYSDFYPSVNLFASRINAQLPGFFAYRPDTKA